MGIAQGQVDHTGNPDILHTGRDECDPDSGRHEDTRVDVSRTSIRTRARTAMCAPGHRLARRRGAGRRRQAGWAMNNRRLGWVQHEENGADFALVLAPGYWGHGAEITRAALDRGFHEFGLDAVLISLPYTRNPARVVARFGFVPDGEVTYDGAHFRQYRLTRDRWESRR